MQRAFIDRGKCTRFSDCNSLRVCPIGAIFRIDNEDPSIVELKFCHGCGDCKTNCPADAVILRNT